VKEALVGEFRRAPEGADTDLVLRFDFVLRPVDHER
jgi:catechol 1,2-dioxygenase